MKYKIFIIIAVVFTVVACNDDILNTKPLNAYSEALVWENYGLAKQFVYDAYTPICYALIQNPSEERAGNIKLFGAACDDLTDNVVINGPSKYSQDIQDVNFNADWGNHWKEFRKCNMVIEKVAASTEMSDDEKAALIAEAKTLRALLYWQKARIFGRFIIVDKVLQPGDEMILPQCETIKDMYDFIIKDLQEAYPNLPEDGTNETEINKGIALAYLAEISLHGAAYLENSSDKQAYYNIAKTAGDSLFALGVYSLDENYGGLFNNYDHARGSSEIMFSLLKSEQNTTFWYTPMLYLGANSSNAKTGNALPLFNEILEGWAGRWPTIDVVANYLMVEDGQAKFWNETQAYKDNQAGKAYVSKLYENRDNRFYASIAYDSCQYFKNTIATRLEGNLDPRRSLNGTNLQTKTSYFVRKGIYFDNFLHANLNTKYHHVLMRYGRAIMNHAEVLLRLGKTSEAIEYINMTRTTHGGLPALSTALSADEAWKWFKIERRVELFMENDRYWSLLRWGKEENLGDNIPELNREAKCFVISEDGKSFEITDLPYNHDANIKTFTARRYLYPVPKEEMIKNPLLTQNPNW